MTAVKNSEIYNFYLQIRYPWIVLALQLVETIFQILAFYSYVTGVPARYLVTLTNIIKLLREYLRVDFMQRAHSKGLNNPRAHPEDILECKCMRMFVCARLCTAEKYSYSFTSVTSHYSHLQNFPLVSPTFSSLMPCTQNATSYLGNSDFIGHHHHSLGECTLSTDVVVCVESRDTRPFRALQVVWQGGNILDNKLGKSTNRNRVVPVSATRHPSLCLRAVHPTHLRRPNMMPGLCE